MRGRAQDMCRYCRTNRCSYVKAGVSLQVLHATGLVTRTRTRDRRHVLYRRTPIADQLIGRDCGSNGALLH